jgi:hypothetical protein
MHGHGRGQSLRGQQLQVRRDGNNMRRYSGLLLLLVGNLGLHALGVSHAPMLITVLVTIYSIKQENSRPRTGFYP